MYSGRRPASSSALIRILAQAVAAKASDIHIESYDKSVVHTADGEIFPIDDIDNNAPAVVSSASRSRRNSISPSAACRRTAAPRCASKGRELDLRVSTVPTMHGESAVMRVTVPACA